MNPRERKFLRKIKRVASLEGRLGFLRLDKNERVEPVSKHFLQEYKQALSAQGLAAYPEFTETKRMLVHYAHLPEKQIFLSHGSDAAIKQIFDVFTREGSNVVLLKPTYGMYQIYAAMAGANLVWVKCNNQFLVDETELLASIDKNTSIITIANPNSPTGSEFSISFLLKCLEKCQKKGALLLIDEAYYHFSKTTMMPYVAKEDNLVVTRTFSKAFGLAGCRAGFMAVSSNLIRSISKACPLYEASALSASAIRVCLENMDEVHRYVKKVEEGKHYIVKQCRKLGLVPYPTPTNFINIRLSDKWSAGKLEDFAKEKGVLIKGKLDEPCFKNCVRVTLGPKKYMAKFIAILKEFLKSSNN